MCVTILDHRRKLSREINNLKSSNSQEFWKLLKKGKTREQPNIPIDKLFEFFKTLNEKPDADPINIPLLDPGNVNELNENINMKISKEEILKCIKKLKNNKACGEDLVINEYIKSTTNTFIDIYEQLFNIIFETGNFPDNWLIFGTHNFITEFILSTVRTHSVMSIGVIPSSNFNR
jgi:hypothetical protein